MEKKLTTTEQELREQLGYEIAIAYQLGMNTQPISVPAIVKNILALLQENGYVKMADIYESIETRQNGGERWKRKIH